MKFVKADAEKNRLDLIPPRALQLVGWVMTYGARKYAPGNWQKCTEPERYIGAIFRHLVAIMEGEILDPESGLPHIGHLIASAMMWHGVMPPEIFEPGKCQSVVRSCSTPMKE